MMGELREEMAERQVRETKAEAAEKLCILLNNAIGFMLESGMSEEEVADYLGCDKEAITAANEDDYEYFAKGE